VPDLAVLVEPLVREPLRPPPPIEALLTRAAAIRRRRRSRRLLSAGTLAVLAAAAFSSVPRGGSTTTVVKVPPGATTATTLPPLHADLGPSPVRVAGHNGTGYVAASNVGAADNPGVLVPARDANGTLIGYWNGDLGLLPRSLVENRAALANFEACHDRLEQIMHSVQEINARHRISRPCAATLTAAGDTVPTRFADGGSGGVASAMTTVPNLIGTDAGSAQQDLSLLGFFATVDASADLPPGPPHNIVTSETPPPGAPVPVNGAIRITFKP
jgi:PASTA domain